MDASEVLRALEATGFELQVTTPAASNSEPKFPSNISSYTVEQLREYLAKVTSWIGYLDGQIIIANISLYETKAIMERTFAEALQNSPTKAAAEYDSEYLQAKAKYYEAKALHESYKTRLDRLTKFLDATKQFLISSMQERKYESDPDIGA